MYAPEFVSKSGLGDNSFLTILEVRIVHFLKAGMSGERWRRHYLEEKNDDNEDDGNIDFDNGGWGVQATKTSALWSGSDDDNMRRQW